MKKKDLLLNLGLALGSLIITIGVLEVALRVTGIESGRPIPVPIYAKNDDPNISYALKPNMHVSALRSHITTDEHGFRSPPVDAKKPTLVFLGDSITFGYGLEDNETIPARVSSLLGGSWNVVNTGVPGYNLLQETDTYKELTKFMKPNALVLVFYFNDLVSMDPAILDTDGAIRPEPLPQGTSATCVPVTTGILSWIPGSCWLDLHSSIYRVLKKIALARGGNTIQAVEEQKNAATFFSETLPPDRLNRYTTTLHAFAKTLPKNLPRLFVIWPDRQIHFQLRPALQKIAEREGFKVLDLYQVFGNHVETLSWDDTHPSAGSASEAGDVIFAALHEWGLVKTK